MDYDEEVTFIPPVPPHENSTDIHLLSCGVQVKKYDDGTLPGVTYFMPDGQDIKLKEELCRVPEYLFDSMKLENVENQKLHHLAYDCIKAPHTHTHPSFSFRVIDCSWHASCRSATLM